MGSKSVHPLTRSRFIYYPCDHNSGVMTIKETFVAKVSRIRNRRGKDKDYFIYRVNLPTEVAEKLGLEEHDYLLLAAQKAEWYHLLDWSKMKATWDKLPEDMRTKIAASDLFTVPEAAQS